MQESIFLAVWVSNAENGNLKKITDRPWWHFHYYDPSADMQCFFLIGYFSWAWPYLANSQIWALNLTLMRVKNFSNLYLIQLCLKRLILKIWQRDMKCCPTTTLKQILLHSQWNKLWICWRVQNLEFQQSLWLRIHGEMCFLE